MAAPWPLRQTRKSFRLPALPIHKMDTFSGSTFTGPANHGRSNTVEPAPIDLKPTQYSPANPWPAPALRHARGYLRPCQQNDAAIWQRQPIDAMCRAPGCAPACDLLLGCQALAALRRGSGMCTQRQGLVLRGVWGSLFGFARCQKPRGHFFTHTSASFWRISYEPPAVSPPLPGRRPAFGLSLGAFIEARNSLGRSCIGPN